MPVVSLGAGNRAHGIHIISSDLFHLWEEHVSRHSKIYTDLIPIMEDVITRYMVDVRARTYPAPEHTVYMNDKEVLISMESMPVREAMALVRPGGKSGLPIYSRIETSEDAIEASEPSPKNANRSGRVAD